MFKIVCEVEGSATPIFYGGKTSCIYKLAAISAASLSMGGKVIPLCENYILINRRVYFIKEVTWDEVKPNLTFNKVNYDYFNSSSKETRKGQHLLRGRQNS